MMVKNEENNGAGEVGLVTPTTGEWRKMMDGMSSIILLNSWEIHWNVTKLLYHHKNMIYLDIG